MLRNYQSLPHYRILFVFNTTNQHRSLAPVYAQIEEAKIVNAEHNDLPLFFAYLLALPFFPLIIFKLLQAKGDERRAFSYVFDVYWFAYGYYLLVRLLIRSISPKAVVVANDHVMWLRAFAKAAQDERIPTIYIQHASVTKRFPPLSFDYALLEGIDTLNKYVSCGPSQTEVFLVGMPKFDAYIDSLNSNEQARSIGICTNPLDTIEEVKKLCDCLSKSFPNLDFILRPHPGDKRNKKWEELAGMNSWQFSSGKEEGVFRFLQCVDVIIAGDSSIHLEAALLNVYPIYYVFGRQKRDSYGFHNAGLVEYCATPEDVRSKINELREYIPAVRVKSKMFNATVNTVYDGRSTELTCLLINQIAHGLKPDLKGWKRIKAIQELPVYQPDEFTNIL